MEMRFLRDEPITKIEQDKLGLSSFLKLIHTSIRATESPFVYGVLGDWGTGKTSAMELLRDAMLNDETTERRFIPIWFNAWLYENEQNLIYPLLHVIKKAHTDLGVIPEQSRFELLFKTVAAAAVTASDLVLRALTKRAFDEAISLEDVTKDVEFTERGLRRAQGAMATWADKVSELQAAFEELIEAYADDCAFVLQRPKESIVFLILIDDLDRCLPSATLSILESVKNFLSVRRCIYVFGMNPAAVYAAIQHKYLGVNVSGREYLEKIINYSFYVPEPSEPDIQEFAKSRLAELIKDDQMRTQLDDKLAAFGEVLSACHYSNPRKIKRILNRYLLFLDRYRERLDDYEINNIVKLVVQAEYYPDLFQLNLSDTDSIDQLKNIGTPNFDLAEFERNTGITLAGDYAQMRRLRELFNVKDPLPPKASLEKHAKDVFAIARLG
jgi:hypothetical protein